MKKWIFASVVAALVAFGGWYWSSPMMAMDGLREAAMEGDKQELAERVDFPAVRESLKSQFRMAMMAEMEKQKDNPFAGLGMALAGAIIDPMIDGLMSPSGVKALVTQGKFHDPSRASAPPSGPNREWTIERDGLDQFRASPVLEPGEKAPTMIFTRDGMGWRLVDIEIPVGGLGNP